MRRFFLDRFDHLVESGIPGSLGLDCRGFGFGHLRFGGLWLGRPRIDHIIFDDDRIFDQNGIFDFCGVDWRCICSVRFQLELFGLGRLGLGLGLGGGVKAFANLVVRHLDVIRDLCIDRLGLGVDAVVKDR